MQTIYGVIRSVASNRRIFTVLVKNRVMYFYLSRSQEKRFSDYIQKGFFVSFNCSDKAKEYQQYKVYEIYNFIKLFKHVRHRSIVYFDIQMIKKTVRKIINKQQYRLFLDLEFTMPPYEYQHGSGFVAEIIQYGAYLEDSEGNLILTEENMVQPSSMVGINSRTHDFLNISKKDFKKAQTPLQFYHTLQDIIIYYQPIIYVWGKNDILMLNKFYEKYNVHPLVERQNIINLMQIMKNYYGIKTDIGLFNAYNYFGRKPLDVQDHNALHDATATAEIFRLFQEEVSK